MQINIITVDFLFNNNTFKLYAKLRVYPQAVSSRENEILAEDEQTFLARQQQILLAGGGLNPNWPRSGESPIRATGMSKASPRAGASPGLQGSPKKVGCLIDFSGDFFLILHFIYTKRNQITTFII